MGEPKFSRPRTQTPTHPWKQARIDEEHDLKERYGLKKVGGMREIWREKSALRRHRNQAMKLIGRVDSTEGHYAKEKEQLLNSLTKKGLLQSGADVGDVLEINVEHMLSRRLQSVVYYKGLAPSMRAARNLIVHGHICIGDQRMTVPGYHVLKEEEDSLNIAKTLLSLTPNIHSGRSWKLSGTKKTMKRNWKKIPLKRRSHDGSQSYSAHLQYFQQCSDYCYRSNWCRDGLQGVRRNGD